MNENTGQSSRKIRRRLLFAGILLIPLFIAAGMLLAASPFAVRTFWLPRAAAAAGVRASVEELALESLFPLRLKGTNLFYSDSETTVEIRSVSTRIRTSKLKRQILELRDTSIDGLRVTNRAPAANPAAGTGSASGQGTAVREENTGEPTEPWTFIMKRFQVRNAAFRLVNRERQTVQVWSAESLHGDRFSIGETCRLNALASVVVHPDRRNPLNIRSLPFRLQAEYRLDGEYRLKEFALKLKTGICDLSVTDEIKVPRQAGIRAAMAIPMQPEPQQRSATRAFAGVRLIASSTSSSVSGRGIRTSGVTR